jgi:hypothetical protein
VKALVIAIAILNGAAGAGCAAAPSEQRASMAYEREDARVRAVEQFELLKQSCRAKGGTLYMERDWGGRFAPKTSEIRSARCGVAVPVSLL